MPLDRTSKNSVVCSIITHAVRILIDGSRVSIATIITRLSNFEVLRSIRTICDSKPTSMAWKVGPLALLYQNSSVHYYTRIIGGSWLENDRNSGDAP
jgi:hypothetical protein